MQYELHQVSNCDALVERDSPDDAVGVYVVVPHGGPDWKSRPLPELDGCAPRYGRSKMLSPETLRKAFTDESERILRDIERQGHAVVFLRLDCRLSEPRA